MNVDFFAKVILVFKKFLSLLFQIYVIAVSDDVLPIMKDKIEFWVRILRISYYHFWRRNNLSQLLFLHIIGTPSWI